MLRDRPAGRSLLFGMLLAAVACLVAGAAALADFREIRISDDEFTPADMTIRVGDTVVWRHEGQRPHSVKSDDGRFDSSPGCTFNNNGPCMRNGQTFAFTFDRPGTYFFHCSVHGQPNGVGMAGHVSVSSSGTNTTSPPTTRPPSTTTTARPTSTSAPASGPTTTQGSPTTVPGTAGATTTLPFLPTTTVVIAGNGEAPATTVVQGGAPTTFVAAPVATDDGDDSSLLLVVVGLVLLAAALAGGAWYFRPGARPPAP